jgi:hypothetical protein
MSGLPAFVVDQLAVRTHSDDLERHVSEIKAIQTRYKGFHFRSRTEARWAVFLDHLDVPWQYEPEGYDLGDGIKYLPDFLLYPKAGDPKMTCWFEVKGEYPAESELVKASRLAVATGIAAFVYWGPIGLPAPELANVKSVPDLIEGADTWHWSDRHGWYQAPYGPAKWELGLAPTAFRCDPSGKLPRSGFWWWTECPHCSKTLLKLKGQVGWCPSLGDWQQAEFPEPVMPRFGHHTDRLRAAYAAARSARFEHGQNGAT